MVRRDDSQPAASRAGRVMLPGFAGLQRAEIVAKLPRHQARADLEAIEKIHMLRRQLPAHAYHA